MEFFCRHLERCCLGRIAFLNCSAHIAYLNLQIWDLFEGKHLFHALDENQDSSATHHVAEMVAFMGLPSLKFITSSEDTMNVFNKDGL